MKGQRGDIHHYLGDNYNPIGQSSPLGSKFAPRGDIKNRPSLFLCAGGNDVVIGIFPLFIYGLTFQFNRQLHTPGSVALCI
jgi:hypothetical protein